MNQASDHPTKPSRATATATHVDYDCVFILLRSFYAFITHTHTSTYIFNSHSIQFIQIDQSAQWQKFVFSMKMTKLKETHEIKKHLSYCNNITFNYNNRDTNVYKYIIKAISFLKRIRKQRISRK